MHPESAVYIRFYKVHSLHIKLEYGGSQLPHNYLDNCLQCFLCWQFCCNKQTRRWKTLYSIPWEGSLLCQVS